QGHRVAPDGSKAGGTEGRGGVDSCRASDSLVMGAFSNHHHVGNGAQLLPPSDLAFAVARPLRPAGSARFSSHQHVRSAFVCALWGRSLDMAGRLANMCPYEGEARTAVRGSEEAADEEEAAGLEIC